MTTIAAERAVLVRRWEPLWADQTGTQASAPHAQRRTQARHDRQA
jgi:hypothetical protein